mmetsp:Transcript_313/g.582  ORF Transcript_313/g.582 Transcript_313/m.582 type:complete len:231 (+) Transcript_313:72-764(+)
MTSLLDLLRLSQRRLPVDLGYCECEGRRVPRQGRRAGLLSAAAALLLGNVPAPARAVSPYKLASELDLGLLKGRIRTCPGNVNPNCVSTSSLSDAYQSPWKTPEQTDMNEACQLIKEVVLGLSPDASLEAFSAVSEEDPERGKYLQFQVPGRFGLDKVEFLVRPDDLSRNWEGDTPGLLVFYRSIAGSVKYIYPIQQPLSDFGEQKKRMQQVRNELGWKLSGCELIECFE